MNSNTSEKASNFPEKDAAFDYNKKSTKPPRKWPYIKNLIALCLSFCLTFTAFLSIQNLQSTINNESGLGVISLACVYGGVAVSCLYSPLVIAFIGEKYSIVLGLVGQTIFTVSNFYPRFYTMIPSSLIFGLLDGPLWSGEGVFLNQLALDFAAMFNYDAEAIISKFNGVFFMFFQFSQIIGNLVSSLVLFSGGNEDNELIWLDNTTLNNLTESFCGAQFCPESIPDEQTKVPQHILYILIGFYTFCSLAALLLFLFCADNRKQNVKDKVDEYKYKETAEKKHWGSELMMTLKAHSDLSLCLLVPTFFWTGVAQTIIFGEYTQAFLSCSLGLQYVGYAMVGYGVTNALFSLTSGIVQKLVGRVPMMIGGFLLDIVLLVFMYLWTPDLPELVLYAFPALWGLGDTIWNATVSALIGVVFVDNQAPAFSSYRMWQSFGFCSIFGVSPFLCMSQKIMLGIGLCGFALLLYLLLEIRLFLRQTVQPITVN